MFGIRRRVVASFEEPVKNLSGQYGYIDLFWPRVLLVEHKSFGKDLGKAESQAFRYIHDLARQGRENEIPRYVIVSDFARIALHDLEPDDQRPLPLLDNGRVHTIEFPLADFHKYIHNFAFIPGYQQHKFEEQDPIILFCLFAEDTGIFERESFHLYLLNRTAKDGSDLGSSIESGESNDDDVDMRFSTGFTRPPKCVMREQDFEPVATKELSPKHSDLLTLCDGICRDKACHGPGPLTSLSPLSETSALT